MKTAVKIIKNSVFSILYKTFFLMVLWIFSVMLGYPILHEGGHAFAGLLTGAEQVSAGIFPQAYVTFRAADLSRGELWLISAAGKKGSWAPAPEAFSPKAGGRSA